MERGASLFRAHAFIPVQAMNSGAPLSCSRPHAPPPLLPPSSPPLLSLVVQRGYPHLICQALPPIRGAHAFLFLLSRCAFTGLAFATVAALLCVLVAPIIVMMVVVPGFAV